jgi:hypothetical protein
MASQSQSQPQTECVELKNIKYKSMMLKNNQKRGDAAIQMLHNTSATTSISNIDSYLENERAINNTEPWGKLDKTVKISKLVAFAKSYVDANGLPESDSANLVTFLVTCIDHKKIVKTKDVNYDKITGKIISIPVLTHCASSDGSGFANTNTTTTTTNTNTNTNTTTTTTTTKFTLRRCDKRQSTLKSLSIPKRKISININDEIIAE